MLVDSMGMSLMLVRLTCGLAPSHTVRTGLYHTGYSNENVSEKTNGVLSRNRQIHDIVGKICLWSSWFVAVVVEPRSAKYSLRYSAGKKLLGRRSPACNRVMSCRATCALSVDPAQGARSFIAEPAMPDSHASRSGDQVGRRRVGLSRRLCDCMWVSFDPRERSICGLATVVGGRGAMVGGASKSCKTCTTVAALISILF